MMRPSVNSCAKEKDGKSAKSIIDIISIALRTIGEIFQLTRLLDLNSKV
jgi:hypothetical protein